MTQLLRFVIFGACAGSLLGCSPKMGSALSASDMSAALPAGTAYALVHLYRPGRLAGFAIGYDVHLNDSVAYRARNGSRLDLRRAKPGSVTLWAKTEAREEITVDLQPGREYYVRCTIGMGAVVGRPKLTWVSPAVGSQELARIAVTAPSQN